MLLIDQIRNIYDISTLDKPGFKNTLVETAKGATLPLRVLQIGVSNYRMSKRVSELLNQKEGLYEKITSFGCWIGFPLVFEGLKVKYLYVPIIEKLVNLF